MSLLFALAGRALRRLDPETAHALTLRALARGLVPAAGGRDDPMLAVTLWDRTFANPVGLAAGFDKNAEVVDPMLRQGFGFVEAGGVTPRPQTGNPRPRVFRLPDQEAVINRLGFNNAGLDAVAARLAARADDPRRAPGPVGINLGKNKDTADAADDYVKGVRALAPFVDFLVVNVSSPNTPGLRALQGRAPLRALLGRVIEARDALASTPRRPLLLKIAPDLTPEDVADVAAVALECAVDGLIVSNTTIARPPEIPARFRGEAGGLSGRPLFAPSTALLRTVYGLTGGRLPLVGVGGIASGDDAYAKIRAGATLVQLYTALIYRGPGLVRRIKERLAERLRADGYARIGDAVGADHRAAAPH